MTATSPRTRSAAPASRDTTPAHPLAGWAALRPLLLRIHFYAGVFVAPFLAVSCLTGLAYVFSPQLGDLVHAHELVVGRHSGAPRPLDDQITAALAAHPEGTLAAVVYPDDPDRTTGVVLAVPGLPVDVARTVYVDPYTAQVRGSLDTWHDTPPLQTTLDWLHRGAFFGPRGVLYGELAASWLWVIALGGLALWVGRWRRHRRLTTLLVPTTRGRPGRRRLLGWHGAVGVWLAAALLFISASALVMTTYAGGRIHGALVTVGGVPTELATAATAIGSSEPILTAAPLPVRDAPTVPVQTALDRAHGAGLTGLLRIRVPPEPGVPFIVAENAGTWPVQRDAVALDPYTGEVTETALWRDWPVAAKLARIAILAHMGSLFGLIGQLALAAMAIGLLCTLIWGYRMWWQRRPTRGGRRRLTAPGQRGGLRGLSWPIVGGVALATVAVGWFLPLLGASLLVFLVGDAAFGVLARRRPRPLPTSR